MHGEVTKCWLRVGIEICMGKSGELLQPENNTPGQDTLQEMGTHLQTFFLLQR